MKTNQSQTPTAALLTVKAYFVDSQEQAVITTPDIAQRFGIKDGQKISAHTAGRVADSTFRAMFGGVADAEYVKARRYWGELSNLDLVNFWKHYTIGEGRGMYSHTMSADTSLRDCIVTTAQESAFEKAYGI